MDLPNGITQAGVTFPSLLSFEVLQMIKPSQLKDHPLV